MSGRKKKQNANMRPRIFSCGMKMRLFEYGEGGAYGYLVFVFSRHASVLFASLRTASTLIQTLVLFVTQSYVLMLL